MSRERAARIKIGAWTASPALNLLERGTQSIKIEPRAMDVLVVLARHGGAVVSVEELIAIRLERSRRGRWLGLPRHPPVAAGARRSCGDTRYIETIPKRGYRLTVPVEPDARRGAGSGRSGPAAGAHCLDQHRVVCGGGFRRLAF